MLLCVLAALAVLLVAGCGSSSSDSSSGSGADSSSGNATSGGGAGDGDDDANRVKFAQCLRENGVDIGDGGGPGGGGGARPAAEDLEQLRDLASGECKEFAQGAFGNVSSEQRQEFQDAFQQFSQCMRDNGVDVPDIGAGGGAPGGAAELDQDDPDFQKAQEACRDKLPQGGALGRGN